MSFTSEPPTQPPPQRITRRYLNRTMLAPACLRLSRRRARCTWTSRRAVVVLLLMMMMMMFLLLLLLLLVVVVKLLLLLSSSHFG